MSKRHPDNGPSFSKSPKKPKLMMADEKGIRDARKDAEQEQTKRDAAKSRAFLQRIHKDPQGWAREIVEKRRDAHEK